MKKRSSMILIILLLILPLLIGCTPTEQISLSPPPDHYRNCIRFDNSIDWLDYEQGLKNTEKRMYDSKVKAIQKTYGHNPALMAEEIAKIQIWSASDQEVLAKLHSFRENYTPVIPFYNNKPHNDSMAWDSQYLFNLSWIYFYCTASNTNNPSERTQRMIMMTPISPEWKIASDTSAREFIDKFNPKFATKKTTGSTKGVEKTIQLGDRKVKALTMVTKYINSDATRDEYYFVYDDWFVCIYDYVQDENTTKWLSELTFKEVILDTTTGELKAK